MSIKYIRLLYFTLFGIFTTSALDNIDNQFEDEHSYCEFWNCLSMAVCAVIALIFLALLKGSFRKPADKDQSLLTSEELNESNIKIEDKTNELQVEGAEKPKKGNKRDYGLLIVIVINIITITILFFTYKFIIQDNCPPCPNETETQIQDDSDIDTIEDTGEVVNGIGGKTTTLGPETLTPELPQFVFLLVGTAHSDTGSADWYKRIISGIATMRTLDSVCPRIRLSSDFLFFDTVPHTTEESRRYAIYDKAIFHNQYAQIVEVKRGLLSNGRFNYFAKLKFE